MPDSVDDRIPPTGGSGTAPPRVDPTLTNEFRKAANVEAATPITILPPHITPELAASYAGFIAHLRAEIDRQAVQLRAEKEHNRRLMAGYAIACRAAASGAAIAHMGTVTDVDSDCAKEAVAVIKADLARADALVIPIAED